MNQPQNIVIFISKLNGGGAEKAALCHGAALHSAGHNITILTLDPSSPMVHLDPEIKIVKLCNRMRTSFFYFPMFLYQCKPNIVISHLTGANFISSLWCRVFPKCTCVITVQNDLSYMLNKKELNSYFQLLFIIISVKLSNRVIAVSEGVKNFLISNAYLDSKKCDIIYNPIVITTKTDKVKSVKNISDNRYILGVGRLVPQKGFDILIKSYAKSILPDMGIRLMIAGDGILREELISISKSLGIAEQITLTGYVPDLREVYMNAEFFVLSSRWEGFGNVVVEALASGTRVVAFNCQSGPSEILNNLDECILVQFDENYEKNLTMAMNEMIQRELFDEFRLLQRSRDFSIDTCGQHLRSLVDKIA